MHLDVQAIFIIQLLGHLLEALAVPYPPVLPRVGKMIMYHFMHDDIPQFLKRIGIAVGYTYSGFFSAMQSHIAFKPA